MRRFPALTPGEILARLDVDASLGKCTWIDATKNHRPLNGKEAGCPRDGYWIIKFNGIPYKRSYLIYCATHGVWPSEIIDHINGDSLDDRAENLREATLTQNNWNHRTRAKSTSLPMGIRELSGRFQARIAKDKKTFYLGSFATVEEAHSVYTTKRKELFNDYCGL